MIETAKLIVERIESCIQIRIRILRFIPRGYEGRKEDPHFSCEDFKEKLRKEKNGEKKAEHRLRQSQRLFQSKTLR